jgi:hypothetical protein
MPFDGREFGQRDLTIEKLDSVTDLLRTENKWCKRELKTTDGRRCILAAPTAKWHSSTMILELIMLARTREGILLGRIAPARTVTVARRVRTFYSALARLGT